MYPVKQFQLHLCCYIVWQAEQIWYSVNRIESASSTRNTCYQERRTCYTLGVLQITTQVLQPRTQRSIENTEEKSVSDHGWPFLLSPVLLVRWYSESLKTIAKINSLITKPSSSMNEEINELTGDCRGSKSINRTSAGTLNKMAKQRIDKSSSGLIISSERSSTTDFLEQTAI